MGTDAIRPLCPIPVSAPLTVGGGGGANATGGAFQQMLQGVLGANSQASRAADAAVLDLAAGNSQDLHTVGLAVAQADLTFRLLLELRNKLTEAFQEVTRMQV